MMKRLTLELRFQIACREHLAFLMWPYRFGRTKRRRLKVDDYDVRESHTHPDLELIIDGFPGSANSFASELFQTMQGTGCLFGDHFHSPAETIKGMKMGIPVMLTLRHPIDSVCSMVRRWPYVDYERALVWYRMFYDAFEPHLDKITVCDFSILISDFGRVVEAINEKHGTSFTAEVTEEDKKAHEPRKGEDREKKREEKEMLRARLMENSTEATREAAIATYERLRSMPHVMTA